MPKGSKRSYTTKKSSRASHVEKNGKNGKSKSTSAARAKQMAYSTVSKEEGSVKRSGTGRGKRVTRSASSRGGQKSART